jgi:hypothetical protein
MKKYTPEVLADIESKVAMLVGDKFEAVKAEFVDFHNDLRVANVWELLDLGVAREDAENVLEYLRLVGSGMDETLYQPHRSLRLDDEPALAVAE